MKKFTSSILTLIIAIASISLVTTQSLQAQNGKKISPEEQIANFYALCKEGRAADAMVKALSTSEKIKPEDSKKVADAFAKLVSGMGKLVDYEIIRMTNITKRVVVIRCAGHYSEQPFVNEFTFYNPGNNDWRVMHMRYDGNPATMFGIDIAAKLK